MVSQAVSAPSTFYPVMLTPTFFRQRTALVVGGGHVAERRVNHLLAVGAEVWLIAPELTGELERLYRLGHFRWHPRRWLPGDIENNPEVILVLTATNDPAVNRAVVVEARKNGRLVNRADAPSDSDFILPGTANVNGIILAVTAVAPDRTGETGLEGVPAFTAWLTDEIAQFLGSETGELAKILKALRPEINRRIPPEQRPNLWKELLASPALELLKQGYYSEAEQILEHIIADYLERNNYDNHR
jgi:siroheme synthase-like protein